ncbi:extracellular solute-binding protein [Numidum massiliense]|uniref:extracellular solute-binding protein n=1 Tax=Numidum massiliense TaxID=1522315 RepID=UPI0006D5452B|nr:extracellular solute-binding protein [Numidum massiliense]
MGWKQWTANVGVTVFAVLLLVLTACSGTGTTDPSQVEKVAPRAKAGDPFGKYEPMLKVHAARALETSWRYDSGDDLDSNVWTREFEKTLGVKVVYDWTTAKPDEYTKKLNVIIASGDELPDVLQVNGAQLKQLAEADQLEDLSDVFDQYAAPFTKELMNQDEGRGLRAATFDGKLLAIPTLSGSIVQNDVLWIRTDWLKEVGLDAPKSIDDVVKIAEAFVQKDPNGSGKKDTFGLGISQGPQITNGGIGDLGGWFAGFNAYPGMWVKDAAGKIVYGSIQPEVKEALAKLREMYQAGLIDREWAVKGWDKLGEDIVNDKVGMFYGANWASYYPMDVSKNKALDHMKPFSAVAVDGKKPAVQAVRQDVDNFIVVKKGYAHPEVVVKLLNVFQEKLWGETADSSKYGTSPDGVEYFKYPLVQSWPTTKDIPDNLDAVRAALASGDTSQLNSEQKAGYDNIKAYNDGDLVKGWGTARQFDAFDIIKKDNMDDKIVSEFYGVPSQTMVEKKASLDQMSEEVYTKIIMGEAPLDHFDTFVADWKKLGGEQMTKEVNDWLAEQK